ncbi:MAG: carboxypeptidase regulatory-like domain-containing protein [Armatimonadota bacterium]|nr:MAG: carboxypeptidase regulatory-like domain-containing protein [Armatimonadota bacterium]
MMRFAILVLCCSVIAALCITPALGGQEVPVSVTSATEAFPRVFGDTVVWGEYGSTGYDVYAKSLRTGATTVVAAAPESQQRPEIWGSRIVWEDFRNGDPDIYMYDLATATETVVCGDVAPQYHPAIFGNRVVWQDYRSGNWDVYMYDLAAGVETPICTAASDQADPVIWGHRIVWRDTRNGNWDVYMYDLATAAETPICTDPTTQAGIAIFGDRIVWEDLRNGNWDIYMYDLMTATESAVCVNPAQQYDPEICGDRIVWADQRNGNMDVYMHDLTADAETQVCGDSADQYNPSIFGDRIAWQDMRNPSMDIYMYDIDPSWGELQISELVTHERLPSISGHRVVEEDYYYGFSDTDICMYDLPSRTFTHWWRSQRQCYPVIWDTRIAWQDNGAGNWDIYMRDLVSGSVSSVCTDAADQTRPAIFGDRVVWEDARGTDVDIYMYDLTGGSESPICTATGDQLNPVIWGDRIVWQDYRAGNGDIYMYDLATATEMPICTNAAHQEHPAIWGDLIVWQDLRNGSWDIYMYDLATGTETPVSTAAAGQTSPAVWGDRIVWSDARKGNWDIYMYDLAAGAEMPICAATGNQGLCAIWGDRIIWEDYRNGNADIYMTKWPAAYFGNIAGQVRVRGTTTNIEGARVELYRDSLLKYTASTNTNGLYNLQEVAAGAYVVKVSGTGFVTQTKAGVVIAIGDTTYVNFNLTASGRLMGQVRIRGTTVNLENAGVCAYLNGLEHALTSTDSNGIYVIDTDLPTGEYMMTCVKPGYERQLKAGIAVTSGATTYVNFNLRWVAVKGQVKDTGTGLPLIGAAVEIRDGDTVIANATTTAPYGVYEIDTAPAPGTYTAIARKAGYVRQTKTGVAVSYGTTAYVNFNLPRSGTLRGQVKDKVANTPLVGATVVARKDGIVWATATTGAPWGIYEMDSDLPAGTYVVGASKAGYLGQTRKDIPVTAGATTYVNFFLQPQ